VFELIYQLTPEEKISDIDGHLLVFIRGADPMSELLADRLTDKVVRLSDASEFQIAFVDAGDRPVLSERAPEFPALFHFCNGKVVTEVCGVDDCLEFFDEFVLANRQRKNHGFRKRLGD
jgi:hypothetical protein